MLHYGAKSNCKNQSRLNREKPVFFFSTEFSGSKNVVLSISYEKHFTSLISERYTDTKATVVAVRTKPNLLKLPPPLAKTPNAKAN